ncbi:alpha/beta hydrolase family protein [Paraglaciecola chathamensis]|uniref:Peptidase S9 prolyl oligopeptidase n=1 Tax=Paraglaciecola agarilytica NO2 TaxID=1125747 RepID=A0ABQ0I580_9ALTE|nr:prolyl oligopeptidase family serine peptidase [Paraglaciecola agarilytica]GAC04492.1 peptidase S9 prolyl oligopeptidase [Paraglaciecola agarilytica NO2]
MKRNAKAVHVALFLIFSQLVSTSAFGTELPPSQFSRLPSVVKPNLSPDGERIALIKNYLNPEISVLSLLDVKTNAVKMLVKSDNEKVKVNWFTWANEKTLIVSLRFASKERFVKFTETRLIAIDVDEEEIKQRNLFKPRGGRSKEHNSQFQDTVVSFLPNDPDHILMALDLDVANLPSVYKVNVNSGRRSRVQKGKMQVRSWMADRQGNVRLGESLSYKTGKASIRYRLPGKEDWEKMYEHNALEEVGINPLGFAKDPNMLFYSAYKGDKKALYKMNLTTQESTLVFEDPEYDVDGSLIYSTKLNDVIGIYHTNSPTGRIYWDDNYKKFQDALDSALPDTSNYLVDFSRSEESYLLYTENDFVPGAYLLGNRPDRTLNMIFQQYPGLHAFMTSNHKLVSYTARDGVKIEGYLTLPETTGGPIATIIHPHGGPGAREYSGFDYWTSFFINRGYAVFRPNFRGSSGYGKQFADSQMQGWGLTMQDDITDAAKWLVDEKIADPKRMCIVGASYGGYAATMAATKTPDLFQCAISFAGVMDLKRLVSKSRHFLNKKFVRKQIGEDKDDLEARSPYHNAAKIKIPILLLHGEDDRVVDVYQSRQMYSELQDLDKQVKYIELENGDHYLSIQRNRHRVFTEMDAFLKMHLGVARASTDAPEKSQVVGE